MEFKYLETVLAVSNYRSFSRAAEEIPCSQASVSRHISDVEKALGYELFNRSTKRGIISLTDQGRLAIPRIEKIVQEYNSLFDEKSAKQQTYRLGIPAGFFNFKAKHHLISYVFEKYPDIHLSLVDAPQSSWLNMLTANQIDGMLLKSSCQAKGCTDSLPDIQQNGLSCTFLKRQQEHIALPKNHPLATRESVSFAELEHETFLFPRVLAKMGEYSHTPFWDNCENYGFVPKIITLEKSDVEYANVRDAAVHLYGCIYPTFQFKWCCQDNIQYIPIRDSLFQAQFHFVTLDHKPTVLDNWISECLYELCNMG